MSPTAEAVISELRSISGLENVTLPQLEECTWAVKQRIFLMLFSAMREKEVVGSSIAATAVENISHLQIEHQRSRETEFMSHAAPSPAITAAEGKWRANVFKAISEALLEMMGRYSSGPSPFSPNQLSRSAVSCHKAFSFLCSRINNSRQQSEWEIRRQLRKIKINERKNSSASIASPLWTNSGRRRSGNNSNPSQVGEGSMKIDEIPVPPPLNRPSPPPQPEVFEGGVEVESYSNSQHGGLEDIVGLSRGGGGSSLSTTIRNVKNENLKLKSENAMLKERVNELKSLYDGLLSLNGQNTAGIRKSRVRMQSAFLQAQVLQLRRQINLQWVAIDAGVEAIQDVKRSLYALKDILKTHCDDIGNTSSTTIPPRERRQTSGDQRKVKLSW
eukprot:114578_1